MRAWLSSRSWSGPAATRCWRCARSSRSAAATRALVAKPTYQLYTVASRNAGAEVLALAPRDGLSLALEELVREAANVRLVWLCSPNNPTGEQLEAALVERICAACPGIVVLDQAYLELGGDDLSGARRASREPRRHAHVLEGLRARRRTRRLRPRAAGAGRGARRAAPARLHLVLVGRRGRAGLPRDRRAARALRRDRRGARLAGRGDAPRGRRGARARRQFRTRPLAVPDIFEPPRRARLRRAHVHARAAAGRLLPRHRLASRRQRAAVAGARRAGGRRGPGGGRRRARRARRRGPARDTRDPHRAAPGPAGRRARARRHGPGVPRPHAHELRVLVAHRSRPVLPG